MAVKRRIIWLSDEEWALLKAQAQEHGETVSSVIRDMWKLAADNDPADAGERLRVREAATKALGHDPYTEVRPVPKPGQKGK